MTDYWAEAPTQRRQRTLFSPTLDDMIPADDQVRLVDEILGGLDWSAWEAEYDGGRGQPPIHPRVIAAAMLYGLCRGLRSTRKLEEACCYRVDFMWLVEGRRIDHTTFAKFRTRFGDQLKLIFRQLCRVALTMGLVRLGDVGFDATRVKAYNSRYHTRTAATLAEKLTALDALFEQMLAEWDATEKDAAQTALAGHDSPTALPAPLAALDARRQQVRAALDKARALDEQRRKDGVDPAKNPAQVPTFDSDARVMPNKEGGFAPNYTPTAATDGARGFIVDCDVLNEVNETNEVGPTVDRIEETCGAKPERLLTDAGNASGAVHQALEERGVELYAPVPEPAGDNPALRDDPTQSVPPEQWDQLPLNGHKKLDKACFVYDAQRDQYHCPLGHALPFLEHKPDMQRGRRVERKVYRCAACAGCPLAARCISASNKRGRTITRDEFEEARQRTARRMRSPAAQAIYDQRPRIAETTFGILKSVLGLRQFLLRGLAKVKVEWRWAATAFNLSKLAREIARLRAAFAAEVEMSSVEAV